MPNNMISDDDLKELQMDEPIPNKEDVSIVQIDTTTTEGRQKHIAVNIQRKEEMINDLWSDGVPSDNRAKRMALELINSSDDALLRLEKIDKESKAREIDDTELAKEMAIALRESFKLNQELSKRSGPIDTVISDDEYDEEILESSLHIGQRVLESSDYMEKASNE